MKMDSLLLWIFLLLPVLGSILCLFLRKPKLVLAFTTVGVLAEDLAGGFLIYPVFTGSPLHTADDWLRIDALSGYHILVMLLVFSLSSIFAYRYFGKEIESGDFKESHAARFGSLWFGSLGAMSLVLLSNNLGLMWVGIEATTLITAFLICIHRSQTSLEATWKYVLLCSVGIALAFLGTLLVGAAASSVSIFHGNGLMWTVLYQNASKLNPLTMKIAFVFLLVGYGTKAGLAPLHNWLPDAHSQAPAPVSALFSGFMLNAALYCIMRYIPIVNAAAQFNFAGHLLLLFGVISMLTAAVFILFQHDIKRLLAYSSVEHLGITAIGLGLGGLGIFAALFHIFNHSVCKTTGFLSAGKLDQIYGTHDMRKMKGTIRRAPVWGSGLFLIFLALVGAAPFAIFMSEMLIIKTAVDHNQILILSFFLAAAGIVFVGVLSHALSTAWGEPPYSLVSEKSKIFDILIVFFPLALLLILGIWMPYPFREVLEKASSILGGKG
jgi:hydrogenase-4 component F